ncbi:MAG: hypothetical protein J6X55_00995, partial [Victivallales bacterium]|nr:hypothetical protein [Victivallales bacterium]
MTRAFAACLMLMCVRLAAVSYYSDEFNQNNCRLQIKCTEVHLVNNLGFYCSRASALLDKILGVKDIPKRKLRVLELVEGGDTGEKSGDDVFQVCFRVNEEELDFSHRLFSELMRRRLFPLCKGGVVTKPFFEAVTAGVCYRYTRGRQALSGYYEPDYEIARNQFMRKEFPKLNVLMGNSVSPKQRYFFELYMMHCDLMLLVFETLQNEQEDCVLKILQAEQAGENP